MAIFDIFSKRQKRLRGEIPDVYQYKDIPASLRVQIIHIWHDAEQIFGQSREIVRTLCREYGCFILFDAKDYYGNRDYNEELARFFLNEKNTEKVLDVIEISFLQIYLIKQDWKENDPSIEHSEIDELNSRFKEHGVGYQFIDGEIIRVDSELIHSEVVKPALRLLNQKI